MGQPLSRASAASVPSVPLPPPPPSLTGASTVSPTVPPGAAPGSIDGVTPASKADEGPVDYLNLPCPVKYEEIPREALMSLKPEHFEGMRFDFTKPLSPHFSLSHGVFMGSVEVPSQSSQVLKIPNSSYEFGANLITPRTVMIGRMLTDGRLTARVVHQLNDRIALRVNAQLTHEPHFSQGMFHVDYKGNDFQTQIQAGNNEFFGFNYIQSVTPKLSVGGEAFWLGQQRKSGVGIATRYDSSKCVFTGQLASTGLVSLTYVQKVTDKVSLASDFLYNWNNKEATTSVGYDYMLRQCRLRGKIDSNGVIAAFLEERLNAGVNLIFSAELDHFRKDYKFGFGMTVGE